LIAIACRRSKISATPDDAIGEAEGSEHRRAGIRDERGVEVLEPAAADEDAGDDREKHQSGARSALGPPAPR